VRISSNAAKNKEADDDAHKKSQEDAVVDEGGTNMHGNIVIVFILLVQGLVFAQGIFLWESWNLVCELVVMAKVKVRYLLMKLKDKFTGFIKNRRS